MTTILHAHTFEEAHESLGEVRQHLERDNHVVIRGVVSEEKVLAARRQLAERFSKADDVRVTPPDPFPMSNYQRLDVGSYGPGSNIRLRRVLALFPWNEDYARLGRVFQQINRIRNVLMGCPADLFCEARDGDPLFLTPQIAQYPKGGGFISPHVDRLKPEITQHLPGFRDTHVVALILSRRGVDYDEGGGWVQAPDGTKVDWEDSVELGDLVVYNGRARHGVDPIDQTAPLDLDHFTGRLFGITNCYPLGAWKRRQASNTVPA